MGKNKSVIQSLDTTALQIPKAIVHKYALYIFTTYFHLTTFLASIRSRFRAITPASTIPFNNHDFISNFHFKNS
jgi:hypothetical protein